jgi:hypothetical protein
LVSAEQTWWCGWSMSGQVHAMSSGRARPAACCPGQNGSSDAELGHARGIDLK